MIALLLAATLYTTTEKDGWTSSSVDSVDATRDTSAIFETDGATARAGSVPWRAWGTTFNELDLDALKLLKEQAREEIMSKLFSPNGDLRFTRGRLVMNANDYSRAWYSCSEVDGDFRLEHFNIEHDKTNQIALIRMAQKYNPALAFWMSPWSPPAWMKINKDYCVVSKTNEFSYRPEYYAVKHFSHFVKPGAIQLAYTPWTDKVKALCYRNPDGGIVVVMTNWADAERRVSFTVAGQFYSLALKPHSFNTVTL